VIWIVGMSVVCVAEEWMGEELHFKTRLDSHWPCVG
jgi:hypothetical protein